MEMTNVGNLLELRRIYSRGITGKGITTAVLDTGIYAHPDFFIPQNKILYFQDFVRNRRGPFDDNGHGTHVSEIIASGGRFGDGSGIGVAPESSIVMLKVLERDGSGKIKNMIKGMEWICMNHKKYGIRIVNISVGMPVKNVENPVVNIFTNFLRKCSGRTRQSVFLFMAARFVGIKPNILFPDVKCVSIRRNESIDPSAVASPAP